MPARRCSICATNWPTTQVYKTCPECSEPTSLANNIEPIPPGEAQSRLNHVRFEDYYEERERELGPLEDRCPTLES